MALAHLQLSVFMLAVSSTCGLLVATLLPSWQVSMATGASIITAVVQLQGLWLDCTVLSTGLFSCSVHSSLLALPLHVQVARASMVLACVLAALGICVAPVGMECTRLADGRCTKRRAALAAGICFLAAGLLGLVPTVWYTWEMVANFLDQTVPESNKQEPGGAVYVGFVSGVVLFVSGLVFCAARVRNPEAAWLHPPKCSSGMQGNAAAYHLKDYV